MEEIFLNSQLVVKGAGVDLENKPVLKIGGFANYATKDRGNDVIVPDAWKKGLENFKKNSILLWMHDHNKPIGKVIDWKVSEEGLYIEAEVSSAAEDLYKTQTLIRDGALKTFSVGFIPKKGRKDTATETLFITELELLEVSVVSIPMQQDSVFSVIKSLEKAGDYEKFLSENVEEFDSTVEEKATSNVVINICVETTDTDNSEEGAEAPEAEEGSDPMEMALSEARQNLHNSINDSIKNTVATTLTKSAVENNIVWAALETNKKVKIDSKNFMVTAVDIEKGALSLQELSILGNPINEILNVDINTLNILNLTKVDTSDHVVFKVVEKRTDGEVAQLFADLVNVDFKDLKSYLDTELPKLAKQQLSYTIDLMAKPIKDWNPDDYIVANKIVDYILFRSHLEADETKNLLMLHGHVEETSEMTQPTVSNNAAEDVAQVAASVASEAPVSVKATASEPNELKLVAAVGAAKEAVDIAQDDSASSAKIKELGDKLAQLMAQFDAQKDKIAAANNDKIAFAANNNPADAKELRSKMTNAVFLMHALNPQSNLTMNNFASTKYGHNLLQQSKATITNVDVLITNYTEELYEQMQIELKIAKTLKSMQITGQKFKIPVADEDVNGDIAMFANGTYNQGETDSTRVPTTRQNTITAVELTPHKFMGTTHLAKDEQEDVLIPLLDFEIRSLVRRMARSIDKSLLRGNGSLSGFTASPSATIAGGNSGMDSVINGLTNLAWAQSGLRVSTGGTTTKATPTNIAAARAALGRYGLDVSQNLVYFTSIEGYNDLVTTSDFRTLEKYGSGMTYITGQIGVIYGIPVVVTEFLDNVGVSGNHVGLLVYVPGFLVGQRRAFEVESWYDPRRQLTAIYLSTRFDMKALTTNSSAALDATKYSMASVIHSA